MILISKPLETVRFHYTSTSKCENEGNEERELERTSDTVAILCMLEMLKSNIERKFADTSIIRRGVERKEELLLQNRII